MSSSSGRDIALSFIGGFLFAVIIFAVIGTVTLQNSDAYGLGHWKLNARMPLATTWINLGYWTNESGERIEHFNEATAQLLKEILRAAGLLRDSDSGEQRYSLAVVDLGFGCGDQTLELVKQTQPTEFTYVGLTLDQNQVTTAYRNIHEGLLSSVTSSNNSSININNNNNDTSLDITNFKLFRADAARPEKWNARVKNALNEIKHGKHDQKWLLALDCLYHFHPSRVPIYQYAAQQLDADGAMAFDIILNPHASQIHIFIARCICLIMGCPWKAFLTREEYMTQLVEECGYDKQQVVMEDVTSHVFLPVADFIERQERRLAAYGVGMGGHKLAGRVFAWFGRSGVVRAVIVVARVRRDN